MAYGAEMIRTGRADVVVAGGTEAAIHALPIAGFAAMQALSTRNDEPQLASRPYDTGRDGFVLGEGAGFLVLQRTSDALADGRRVLARITGHAENSDAYHLVAPHPDGAGALLCMRAALADAALAPAVIGSVNAHATGTTVGDSAEARALDALFEERDVPVTAVKGTTGHLIAASGAVEAVVAALTVARGSVPPVAGLQNLDPEVRLDVVTGEPRSIGPAPALSTSFGFGGANACVVVEPA
jgi:3-oxoacyl-[acyl-carrier-protein] synthase II